MIGRPYVRVGRRVRVRGQVMSAFAMVGAVGANVDSPLRLVGGLGE